MDQQIRGVVDRETTITGELEATNAPQSIQDGQYPRKPMLVLWRARCISLLGGVDPHTTSPSGFPQDDYTPELLRTTLGCFSHPLLAPRMPISVKLKLILTAPQGRPS
jgi:hypothetical protein